MKQGLFTRQELKKGTRKKVDRGKLSAEYIHQVGPGTVRSMNPQAKHPEMKPTGSDSPTLYVLGEAPGAEEDKVGRQFVGKSGAYLRELLRDCDSTRFDNCCRTRPPGNRTPTTVEIESFRKLIEKDIEKTKPKAILGVGAVAMQWALPNIGGIGVCRGRRFPVQIGSHRCWFYPIHHPAYILRITSERKVQDIPGEEWQRTFHNDIAEVIDSLPHLMPPRVASTEEEDLMDGITLVTSSTKNGVRVIRKYLEGLLDCRSVAVDIETTCIRPFRKEADILCIGVGNSKRVISFSLGGWSARDNGKILQAFKAFLQAPGRRVAHNLSFEMEWFVWLFGKEIARSVDWGDTIIQAYLLDERRGGHSLDFLCRLYFGLPLKSLSNTPKDLSSMQEDKLLRYNALDVKYTHKLYFEQVMRMKDLGLGKVYKEQLRRLPTIVLSQREGLPVSQKRVERFRKEYADKIDDVMTRIRKRKEVELYEKVHGTFSPTSVPNLVIMFRDVLERKEGYRGTKYSTDKEVLDAIDHPFAELIRELRTLIKLKSTYIDPLYPDHAGSLLYPDRRLHPHVNIFKTATGRLSYEDPNLQNFPKRHHAEIRSQITAGKGNRIVACDYGQLEARVIAMASGDAYLCKAIKEGYDIHMEWAEKVAAVSASSRRKLKKDKKAFRTDVKSKLVFAGFYGAKPGYISRMLELPDRVGRKLLDEFWDTFSGVRRWQVGLRDFYDENGYVECLTGRRRHAPLSDNMIINSPIQGSASDIVVDAMNRLSVIAMEESRDHLQSVLNVHDDLTFVVPEHLLEDALETIVKEMTSSSFAWVTVPLSIEVSVGKNWYKLDEVGVFESEQR
jgi:uracil-DNA glycosylase family 4